MDSREFYDADADRAVRDYVYGNARVVRQRELWRRLAHHGAGDILVIGCGAADTCAFLAEATGARVLGIDLSPACIERASHLFAHPRVRYTSSDILQESPGGLWDAIVLPDSYEHFPRSSRPALHAELASLLTDQGRLLLTVPSPGHQRMLRERGEGLQPVDEDVTLEDLITLAAEVRGCVTYFAMISVFGKNDYIHAMIDRDSDRVSPLVESRRGLAARAWSSLHYRLGVALRKRRARRALGSIPARA